MRYYVFDIRDLPEQGIVVDTESEAIEICKNDETCMTVYKEVE